MPWCESECSIESHISRARASTSASGTSTVAASTAASSAASRNSASMRCVLVLRDPRADVLAQLVERVEAGLLGELVVERGQLLGLDLADRDRELGLLAGQLGRAGSPRGR